MSRNAVNGILLLLVAALGVAVWLTPPRSVDRPEPLTTREASEIREIRLQNRNGTDLRLSRRGDGWWMSSPYPVAANRGRIGLLLNILSTPSHESFPAPESGLEEFGLAPPGARLTLDDLAIEMGGTHPYNHQRYLRIGDRIHLIQDIFPHHLMAAAEAYVSPALLPPGARIQALQTPDWRIERTAGGDWRLSPEVPGLSQDALVTRIQSWQQARALQVLRAPEEAPEGAVVIRLRGATGPIRFDLVRGRDGPLLVRRDLGLAWRLAPGSPLLAPLASSVDRGPDDA